MKKIDRKNWQEKTEKLNKNIKLKPGMEVVDLDGYNGVVVQVREPNTLYEGDEGRIAVWQSDRFEYGGDNCEHYSGVDWKSFLRVKMDMKLGVDLTKDCYFFDDTGRTPYMYKMTNVVAIEGDFCIAKAVSTAPEWEMPPETLVFNLKTKEVLQEEFRFWQVTDDFAWIEESFLVHKERRAEIDRQMKPKPKM